MSLKPEWTALEKIRNSNFSKIAYAMTEKLNLNPDSPNWDIAQLAFECMTKSIYPDILFITQEQWEQGTVVYPMGCRAFLSPWKMGKERKFMQDVLILEQPV